MKNIDITPGINPIIIESLLKSCNNMKSGDKICSLIFDEMSRNPQLHYDKRADKIVGFVDFGDQRECKIADLVIVFMVRGLRKKWKMPISFSFVEGSLSTIILK